MRGESILKILEIVAELGARQIDIIAAMLESGYGASSRQLMRVAEKRYTKRLSEQEAAKERRKLERRAQILVSKLKHDGLITDSLKNKGAGLKLTLSGINKLKQLKKHKERRGDLPPILSYPKESGVQTIIVTFDIPEYYRPKRSWLRAVLTHLKYEKLQKSVWIGKTKIPRELIEDIKNNNLIDFVEILAITKSGSLKELI